MAPVKALGLAPLPRFGTVPLRTKASQKSSCRSRAGGKQQLPQKRRQPLARKGSQPLARKASQLKPRPSGARGQKAAQGITNAQKAARGITRSQPRACKAPHAMQSAFFLRQQTAASARKRLAEGQLSQPLARKRPRKSSSGHREERQVFDSRVSEAEHLQYHANFKGCCIRCDKHMKRKVYEALTSQAGGPWISTGVNSGLWGLGCTACAEYLASGRKCSGARFSKWATFQVRPKTRIGPSFS